MSERELSFLVQRKVKDELKKRIKEYLKNLLDYQENYRTEEQWERINEIIDREVEKGNHNIWLIIETIDVNGVYKS